MRKIAPYFASSPTGLRQTNTTNEKTMSDKTTVLDLEAEAMAGLLKIAQCQLAALQQRYEEAGHSQPARVLERAMGTVAAAQLSLDRYFSQGKALP